MCSYNPYDGPNEHPEAELPLVAGKYLYVYGTMDDDGFYEGERESRVTTHFTTSNICNLISIMKAFPSMATLILLASLAQITACFSSSGESSLAAMGGGVGGG